MVHHNRIAGIEQIRNHSHPAIGHVVHRCPGRAAEVGATVRRTGLAIEQTTLAEYAVDRFLNWPLEVVDLLLLAERRNWLHESDSIRFLSLLSRLPIYVERAWPEKMMRQLLGLGRDGWLSSFDAAYLDLAMRHGLSIATIDSKLLEAARRVNVAPYVLPQITKQSGNDKP